MKPVSVNAVLAVADRKVGSFRQRATNDIV